MDVCAVAASSVPCERLFSAGGQTATDRRSRLGAERFEQLQILKFLWRGSIVDRAAGNSALTEEVLLDEYVELFRLDAEISSWDCDESEVVSE